MTVAVPDRKGAEWAYSILDFYQNADNSHAGGNTEVSDTLLRDTDEIPDGDSGRR